MIILNCVFFRGTNRTEVSATQANHDDAIIQLQIDSDMIAASDIRDLPKKFQSSS